MRRWRLAAAAALVLAGCRGPTVNLSTAKPLAVDVTLRVDIYQHAATPGAEASTEATPEAAEDRRRTRMAEIQTLKNSRLVGENRRGLLSIVEPPPGDYGAYVERTVAAENADRSALMQRLAAERRQPLATVEAEQAKLWRERAFAGEWVEEETGGTWRWVQRRAEERSP